MQTQNTYVALDAEELFRLGLQASNAQDSAAAINFLKQATERDPCHAKAAWLLGAEYAQIGMMDRAQAALERSVELEPDLTGARFQLGLLHLTSGQVDAATRVWEPLDAQDDDNPYRLFKAGMLHMVVDEFEPALVVLRRCAALPRIDPALQRDVQLVISQIENRSVGIVDSARPEDPETTSPSSLLFMTAYQKDRGN